MTTHGSDGMPVLPGVEHRYVRTPDGVTIHVAEAGPADGKAIMLVHGFPQHWYEWKAQIGPLAADGYHVIVPDLRGAGWSDAPRMRYPKTDMADDLLAVLDELGVERTWVASHDWGGIPGAILLLRHPERVSGYAGFNTIAPWLKVDLAALKHLWSFWYQYPILCPGVGPRMLSAGPSSFIRFLVRWVGGGWEWPADDYEIYLSRMRDPARAYAGSQWYRTFQSRELLPWIRGRYADARVTVPMRWVTGLRDPVITPVMHRGYERYASDLTFEHVPDVGHWIAEQAPELVLDRLRTFLKEA